MGNMVQASSIGDIPTETLDWVWGKMIFAKREGDGLPLVDTAQGYETPMVTGEVKMHDARPVIDRFSLEKHGFAVVKHKSLSIHEANVNSLREKYIAEMIPFLMDMFQPSRIVAPSFGGVAVRPATPAQAQSGDSAAVPGLVQRRGSGLAHCDFAAETAQMIVARDCAAQGLEPLSYSRLVIMQMWRPLTPPPQDYPLAFCDASTILSEDLQTADYQGFGQEARAWSLRYNPDHRWYYLPEMSPDELFLFNGYDSDMHGRSPAAHGTFDNREKFPDAIPRGSIEARFYLYYD